MASPVIRARIAPLALLITLSFVIIGFLRVDREMTQAETDRAGLMVSQLVTLVEAFLLEHVVALHTIERLVGTTEERDWRDSLVVEREQVAQQITTFDNVWI